MVNKLDPRVKILLLIVYNIVVFSLHEAMLLAVLLALLLVLWKIAGLSYGTYKTYLRFFLPLFVILLLMQSLFVPGGKYLFEIGRWRLFSDRGLMLGALLGLRLFVLILLMPLLVLTTSINELILGLTGLGIPYKTAYLITTAINIMPLLRDDIKGIRDSQMLRGFAVFEKGRWGEKLRAYPVLVVPLIIGAVRRAQTMGTAMDVRAYGVSRHRTYRHSLKLTKGDIFFGVFMLILALALLWADRRGLSWL